MRREHLIVAGLFLAVLVVVALFALPILMAEKDSAPLKVEECYIGVSFCGNTTAEAKLLIDRVKTYTNLFVIQSGPVSWNETSLNEICDYAVAEGLKIIVYFGDFNLTVLARNGTTWRINWMESTRLRWGDSFLGVYYYDEPGGIWLDTDTSQFDWRYHPNATYDSTANRFILGAKRELAYVPNKSSTQVFVSDYALYWFDYLGSYDVVLAQAGWNHSLPQDVALVRGAANLQKKDWGVIITWKYRQPPYLDTGQEIYSQMFLSYLAGAKYIVIFNYPSLEGNQYGVMQDEHFEALEKFWKDAATHSIAHGSVDAEAVMVLPRNYGWGMRNPEDTIWGSWGSDEKSPQIWALSRALISKYGFRLDIVYDDPAFPIAGKYPEVYCWNSTVPQG